MGKTLRRPIVRFHRGSPPRPAPQQHAAAPAPAPDAPSGWASVDGAFEAEDVYDLAFRRTPAHGRLVEVTAGKGRSSCYLAERARGRDLKVSVVHTSPETADEFSANVQRVGVPPIVDLQMCPTAAEQSVKFDDGSLSFVFLDTQKAVDCEIAAWWPKLERGGLLSGVGYEAARAQVDAFIAAAPSERALRVHKGSWMIYRPVVVDATFCIGSAARTDRRAAVEAQFRSAGIAERVEFFEAVDGKSLAHPNVISNNQAGCLASHLAVIAEARRRGNKNVLIFEDDVQLTPDFEAKFHAALSRCPSTFDVIYVGAICVGKWGHYLHGFDDLLALAGRVNGTHAYVVNTDIEPRLRTDLEPMRTWYDEYLLKTIQPERRCYVCVPYLALQVPGVTRTEDFSQQVWR